MYVHVCGLVICKLALTRQALYANTFWNVLISKYTLYMYMYMKVGSEEQCIVHVHVCSMCTLYSAKTCVCAARTFKAAAPTVLLHVAQLFF